MSRSLYSLDRESASKLLTKNNLAKPMRSQAAAADADVEKDFTQLKEVPSPPAAAVTARLPMPVRASSPAPVPAPAPVLESPDPRQVEQEERWLQAQVQIKELEQTLAQVAIDDEKMAVLKQKGAELEGINRLLEDQMESLTLKLQTADQKVERMTANLQGLKGFEEEAEKLKVEVGELRTRLTAKESEAIGLVEARDQVTALELERNGLMEEKATLQAEQKEYEAKVMAMGQELSKIQSDVLQLQHDLEVEKGRTASALTEAEQVPKFRKQVETARDLLNKAAEDNVRLEKERNELKGKLQAVEAEKTELAGQKQALENGKTDLITKQQLLEGEKKELVARIDELNTNLSKTNGEIVQLNQDLETEKFRVNVLQPDAEKLPAVRKELEDKTGLLEKALESRTHLEKERDDLQAVIRVLENEKAELAQGKQTAELDRIQFSGKLNELGKDLLTAKTERDQLREELAKEKARPIPEIDQQEMEKLRKDAGLGRESLAKAVEDKSAAEKDRDAFKEKVEILELEVKKSKDALKQAVMAYHDARTQKPA